MLGNSSSSANTKTPGADVASRMSLACKTISGNPRKGSEGILPT